MAKNSKEAYGATGESKVLMLDPEKVKIVTDKKHPLYDERVNLPVSEALVKNIMVHGVLEPVIIRKNPENGDVEIVAGRQRTKACREANKRLDKEGSEKIMLPATVRRGDEVSLVGVMASENEIREGDSPLVRAEKMQRLLNMGKTEDEVGVYFGCGKATVKNSLAVLECTAPVRKAVDDGQINVTAAYGLAKLEPEEQKKTLEKMIAAGASANGKRGKSRAQKAAKAEATGKTIMVSKKEIVEYRADLMKNCNDHDFKTNALLMLDFVLGKRGRPKFPKAED
jgi:ParB family transcriptional regulator, chromosome partitioning protein